MADSVQKSPGGLSMSGASVNASEVGIPLKDPDVVPPSGQPDDPTPSADAQAFQEQIVRPQASGVVSRSASFDIVPHGTPKPRGSQGSTAPLALPPGQIRKPDSDEIKIVFPSYLNSIDAFKNLMDGMFQLMDNSSEDQKLIFRKLITSRNLAFSKDLAGILETYPPRPCTKADLNRYVDTLKGVVRGTNDVPPELDSDLIMPLLHTVADRTTSCGNNYSHQCGTLWRRLMNGDLYLFGIADVAHRFKLDLHTELTSCLGDIQFFARRIPCASSWLGSPQSKKLSCLNTAAQDRILRFMAEIAYTAEVATGNYGLPEMYLSLDDSDISDIYNEHLRVPTLSGYFELSLSFFKPEPSLQLDQMSSVSTVGLEDLGVGNKCRHINDWDLGYRRYLHLQDQRRPISYWLEWSDNNTGYPPVKYFDEDSTEPLDSLTCLHKMQPPAPASEQGRLSNLSIPSISIQNLPQPTQADHQPDQSDVEMGVVSPTPGKTACMDPIDTTVIVNSAPATSGNAPSLGAPNHSAASGTANTTVGAGSALAPAIPGQSPDASDHAPPIGTCPKASNPTPRVAGKATAVQPPIAPHTSQTPLPHPQHNDSHPKTASPPPPPQNHSGLNPPSAPTNVAPENGNPVPSNVENAPPKTTSQYNAGGAFVHPKNVNRPRIPSDLPPAENAQSVPKADHQPHPQNQVPGNAGFFQNPPGANDANVGNVNPSANADSRSSWSSDNRNSGNWRYGNTHFSSWKNDGWNANSWGYNNWNNPKENNASNDNSKGWGKGQSNTAAWVPWGETPLEIDDSVRQRLYKTPKFLGPADSITYTATDYDVRHSDVSQDVSATVLDQGIRSKIILLGQSQSKNSYPHAQCYRAVRIHAIAYFFDEAMIIDASGLTLHSIFSHGTSEVFDLEPLMPMVNSIKAKFLSTVDAKSISALKLENQTIVNSMAPPDQKRADIQRMYTNLMQAHWWYLLDILCLNLLEKKKTIDKTLLEKYKMVFINDSDFASALVVADELQRLGSSDTTLKYQCLTLPNQMKTEGIYADVESSWKYLNSLATNYQHAMIVLCNDVVLSDTMLEKMFRSMELFVIWYFFVWWGNTPSAERTPMNLIQATARFRDTVPPNLGKRLPKEIVSRALYVWRSVAFQKDCSDLSSLGQKLMLFNDKLSTSMLGTGWQAPTQYERQPHGPSKSYQPSSYQPSASPYKKPIQVKKTDDKKTEREKARDNWFRKLKSESIDFANQVYDHPKDVVTKMFNLSKIYPKWEQVPHPDGGQKKAYILKGKHTPACIFHELNMHHPKGRCSSMHHNGTKWIHALQRAKQECPQASPHTQESASDVNAAAPPEASSSHSKYQPE